MERSTDIDRKLAIYYHPLFQEVMNLLLKLFKLQSLDNFQLGLIQFLQFNLKLQKCLLPTFQIQNAMISALNDWVKEVAQCLAYQGMVKTNKCQQVNDKNVEQLIRKQMRQTKIQLLQSNQKYVKTLLRMGSHDAFKLLGVRINKQVFNKFLFDLCSTWCQFLDIQLFVYFMVSIYLQLSEGRNIEQTSFKSTHQINPIQLEFMEQFQEIKSKYSKGRKKQLRYYRAWCEWNYLRVGQIGQGLILCLDNIKEDNRILQMALVFQNAIKVINEEITNQSQTSQPIQSKFKHSLQNQEQANEFLILKKLHTKQRSITNTKPIQNSLQLEDSQQDKINITKPQQNSLAQPQDYVHQFQIQIDEVGNMFLKRVVKLPILGKKIEPIDFNKKNLEKLRWIQKKKQQCRQVSNLYRRLENMKVRLQHNSKNDYYSFKKNQKISERDQFYKQNQYLHSSQNQTQIKNQRLQKSIHQKVKPSQQSIQVTNIQNKVKQSVKYPSSVDKSFSKPRSKEALRKNQNYIHQVMAPTFITDNKNNISYLDGQSLIYGNGAQDQRRDIKFNLPKIKYLNHNIKQVKSYHIVGKLVTDRKVINQRVKSISMQTQDKSIRKCVQTESDKIQKLKEEYKHVWNRYIQQEQILQLNNYSQFYRKLQGFKQKFSSQYQSQYRKNLKPILLYENKRYQMGGSIQPKDQERFYDRMKRLIKRDQRRQKKKKRKNKWRNYRNNFKNKKQRSIYEDIFINYHKAQIKAIKQERAAEIKSIKALHERMNKI